MIRFELCAQTSLLQLLLQVSVKLQRVVLRHNYADLLVLSGEIPENALSHSLESTDD